MIVAPGSTSVSIDIFFADDTGAAVTGKTASDFPAAKWSSGSNTADTTITLSDLVLITTAHPNDNTAGGVKEREGGWYRLDLPNNVFTAGGRKTITFAETTNKRIIAPFVDVQYVQSDLRQTLGTNSAGAAGSVRADSVTGAVGSVTGAVGSVTGNVGGNVNGNVSGSVGSVSGAVGSVAGAVGSVTGNVGGNVVGSTGSVSGAVGSVSGNVGGDVSGKVLGGGASALSGDGVRAASVTGAVGSVTGAIGSYTGNTPQTGDSFSRVGAPAGASISADIAAKPTAAQNASTLLATALTQRNASALTTSTVEDALSAARAQGGGAWTLVGTTLTLKNPDGTTFRAFVLDSGTAPTTRT